MIDPAKEIGAAVDEIEAGLTSLQRKQRELGYDPDVIAREREEDGQRGGGQSAPANRNGRPDEDETIEEDDEDERQ
jgi:capsid protein